MDTVFLNSKGHNQTGFNMYFITYSKIWFQANVVSHIGDNMRVSQIVVSL